MQKGERSCTYWLDVDNFDIIEAYSYAFSQRDKREVRELLFTNFYLFVDEWNHYRRRK